MAAQKREPLAKSSMTEFIEYCNQTEYFVGKPADICDVRIASFDSDRLDWKDDGELGEVLVTGPHVVKQYLLMKRRID